MALPESALSELLDALRVGDGVDLVREIAQWALQALIETEANAAIVEPFDVCEGGQIDDYAHLCARR